MVFLTPLIFAIIFIAVHCFQNKTTKEEMKGGARVVRLHPAYRTLGYVLCGVSCAVAVFLYFYSGIEAALVLLVLGAICLLLVLGYYGFAVYYDDKHIRYRRFFGSYKILRMCQIVDIEAGLDLYIRTEKDCLHIPNYSVGVTALYEHLLSVVNLEQKPKTLPPRVRKFRESIYRPGEMIFVLCLLECLSVGSLVFVICYICMHPENRDGAWMGILLFGVFALFFTVLFIATIMSVKRAHASAFWMRVMKLCIREGYYREP